jgi:hypothetical protein
MNDEKLRNVVDILEIQALKAQFFEVIDSIGTDPDKAAAELRELLSDDVTADYGPFGFHQGRESVIQFFVGAYSQFEWDWHSLHSPRVKVNGDTAVGFWTSNGHAMVKGSGAIHTSINRYSDEFVRTPAGWQLSYIRDIVEAHDAGSGLQVADHHR